MAMQRYICGGMAVDDSLYYNDGRSEGGTRDTPSSVFICYSLAYSIR